MPDLPDANDAAETSEWLESVDSVVESAGADRAGALLDEVLWHARLRHLPVGSTAVTPYQNTICASSEMDYPGDEELEDRIENIVRWNAMAMVVRANALHDGLGGHLSTFSSAATLYEVGQQHFFRGWDDPGGGDQVFFQGHASPGMYSRAFLEGHLDRSELDRLPSPTIDAQLLAIPDRFDGSGTHQCHLPGSLQSIPLCSKNQGHQRAAGLGIPRRRRV